MIKRFGFRNFSSFKDGAEINFTGKESSSDEETLTANLSTVMGIKGANGSGKTNILKAITFLYSFCSRRMKTTIDSKEGESKISLPFSTFMDNEDTTEFYIEFIVDEKTYYYELDITQSGIVREEVKRKNNKEISCLIRVGNKITKCLKEYDELKSLKLKSDQSIFSIIDDYDFNSPMIDLAIMSLNFVKVISNVGVGGYRSIASNNYFKTSELYLNNKAAFAFTKKIISSVDNGITNITINKTKDKTNGKTLYYPLFVHKIDNKKFSVSLAHESMGTKVLFQTLYKYWLTIENGSLLILDEFDMHLHAMILPEIIELFTNSIINSKNAQLIITAHNTEILDSLGRYNTLLINKDNNESYCYRLDKVPLLRNDRLISPLYTKGKIGGTPQNIKGITSRIAKQWIKNG